MNPDFTLAALGGLLIAISVIMMMALIGRVTGISGILWQSVSAQEKEAQSPYWRYFFLLGLIIGPILMNQTLNWNLPSLEDTSFLFISISGVLVGFGTKLGSGCTSGHGICGVARFSKRSIVATLTFMTAGIATVAINKLF